MAEQALTQFTYEGIPPLPDDPTPLRTGDQQMGDLLRPRLGSAMTFQSPRQQTGADGIPLFELVARRKADGTYDNVEFVSILIPGDTKSVPRHKVTDQLRERYQPYYEMWRRGLVMSPTGTPLEMWPVLTPAQVHELKGANIFTVEQLRDVADANLARVPFGATLRRQAKDWLLAKKDADVLAERGAENQALRDGQEMLQKQLADMSAEMDRMRNEMARAKPVAGEDMPPLRRTK